LSNQPESFEGTRVVVRRRRPTRRHRRNRLIRRALVVVCAILACGFSLVALQYLSPSLFHASRDVEPRRQTVEVSPAVLVQTEEALRPLNNRKVYPYSVVPGGVNDAQELKWAARHDPVVAAHYAGFDYDHARVVRLTLARTAYISYRIGNKVYWTRHRVSLKKGETVITDGKITARTRCANRVEEVPQQATSQSEPPAAKFEEPIQPATGTAVASPPVPFESSLLNRMPPPGLGPAAPLTLYDPFGNGNVVPIFPPPIPEVCNPGITKKKPGVEGGIGVAVGKGKKKVVNPCGTGGLAEVPEPGTWVLMVSGLAFIFWIARRKLARPRLARS
jgi:hypothetical protein